MKTTILLLISFFIFSCSNDNDDVIVYPQTIIPTEIIKGHLNYNNIYGNENIVISNTSDWQTLMTNFSTIGVINSTAFSETNIDFQNFIIIFVTEVFNSTTTIDITNIQESANNIIVTVENLQVGVTADVAHPFHIVKIPKTTKPIIFQ
ncbi:hypothetical protein [uncultured Flavobacterium sp.]|uniref:hypothetical protein n=1 Tax=uncultured Flavobacterium sp. TaxID=165435 RepID=UPI0030EE8855|tara:strand:+ start:78694 stop:79140 length:447 start_codon:yes stop_codon:yes gene_type:complete